VVTIHQRALAGGYQRRQWRASRHESRPPESCAVNLCGRCRGALSTTRYDVITSSMRLRLRLEMSPTARKELQLQAWFYAP
jgi:hypothetical protein